MLLTKSYDHRMRPARRLRPRHDADLVAAHRDGQVHAGHGAHARAPQARGVHDARRLDVAAARAHARHAAPLGEDAQRLGLLHDARAAVARGPREALGRLGGVAVARRRLVAAGHEVLGPQARLDLAHLVGRDEARADADRALERHRRLHGLAHALVDAEEVAGVAEPARAASRDLREALEAVERVEDHAARFRGGVVLAHAGRALARAPRGHEALVEDDNVTHAPGGEVEREARARHAAADDDDIRGERHGRRLP